MIEKCKQQLKINLTKFKQLFVIGLPQDIYECHFKPFLKSSGVYNLFGYEVVVYAYSQSFFNF